MRGAPLRTLHGIGCGPGRRTPRYLDEPAVARRFNIRGRAWRRAAGQQAINAQLPRPNVFRAKAGEIDLSIRDGGRRHFGVVIAVVPAWILKRIPKLAIDIVGVVGMQNAGAGLIP